MSATDEVDDGAARRTERSSLPQLEFCLNSYGGCIIHPPLCNIPREVGGCSYGGDTGQCGRCGKRLHSCPVGGAGGASEHEGRGERIVQIRGRNARSAS